MAIFCHIILNYKIVMIISENLLTDGLTYWDYIKLDAVLDLQKPKTSFPDEKNFIIYHQISELYFRLVLLEMEQLCFGPEINEAIFRERLIRMNIHMRQLIGAFSAMQQAINKEQFLQFRKMLYPASGFQSFQYRLIQLHATDIMNLIATDSPLRNSMTLTKENVRRAIDQLYWRIAPAEAPEQKRQTLKAFDEKYYEQLLDFAIKLRNKNVSRLYSENRHECNSNDVGEKMREFDRLVNFDWPMAHIRLASFYLDNGATYATSTGGVKWQEYLHPQFQKITFFPELWSDDELRSWGLSPSS